MADRKGSLKKAGHAVSTTVPRRKKLLEGVDLDEDRDVGEQLTEILSKKAVKVMDLFREWDTDGAGPPLLPARPSTRPLTGKDVPPCIA